MGNEAETNARHERASQNTRETLSVGNGELVERLWDKLQPAGGSTVHRLISEVQLAEAMLDAVRDFRDFATARQAEVPMEAERPLDANVERLVADYPAHGTALALAQSLKAMGDARAADGAEGHAVVCRRAARFVRVMAMQVTRFLAQPDLRLSHPTLDADLQVTATDVSDNGQVAVHCNVLGQADMPATYPLHELVAAGPVSDISRTMVQIMARTVTMDALGQLMKDGRMPGLDELTARHGLDFEGIAVGFEPPPGDDAFTVPSDSAWQPAEQLAEEPQSVTTHNLSAHAGYVLKDGQCVPDDLPVDGQ